MMSVYWDSILRKTKIYEYAQHSKFIIISFKENESILNILEWIIVNEEKKWSGSMIPSLWTFTVY